MEPVTILLFIAIVAGLYLAFNIGANDVANAMGTSVGSGALTIKQAVIAAAIFELLGALLIGDEVSRTIKDGFVSPEIFVNDPLGFAYGMTGSIIATALWLQYATFKGLPVSTTHSIVGAVLGFAIMHGGLFEIRFKQLLAIFSSWMLSPVLGGLLSYISLRLILRFIIDSKEPMGRIKRWAPSIIAAAVLILSLAFSIKLAAKLFDEHVMSLGVGLALLLSLMVAWVFRYRLHGISCEGLSRGQALDRMERVFGQMQLITACFLAFAHGSNDVANAIGPAAAVIASITENSVADQTSIPLWLLLTGGVGIVLGLAVFGRKVISTVGQKITEITPSRGFAAEFGASSTILMGTLLGLPLSTTHVLVGSVIGVGFARGISGIDVVVIKRIARSWIITMPMTAIISMIFCLVIRYI